ncbi:MAG TPA: GNAT family N-acetyltransferase [Methanoculleus sp.]|jgi:ribosomal protein S18 acetylase RimI-like enzyme|nr:GNAT family N-acetyltransferase [Methanoculleus sp.]
MLDEIDVEVRIVDAWDVDAIADLYRAGGWWKEEWNPAGLSSLIRGSFAFAVAVESSTSRTVGMGRVISDGVSDGYVQDLVVHPNYRDRDIGTMILSALLKECTSAGVTWIALIAEPETEAFYARSGFQRMEGHTPMRWYPEKR